MASIITMLIYSVIGIGCIAGSAYLSRNIRDTFDDLMKVKSATDVAINEAGNMNIETKEKISGIARTYKDTVTSPLQNEECIAYESKIQNTAGAIKSTIFEEEDSAMFIIGDGDQEILVDPRHPELYLDKDLIPINNPAAQNIIAQETTGKMPASNVSIEEGTIEPRDSVFIYGDLEYRQDDEYGRAVQSNPEADFVISNMNTSKIRNLLMKQLFVRTGGIILLFVAGIIILGLGFSVF